MPSPTACNGVICMKPLYLGCSALDCVFFSEAYRAYVEFLVSGAWPWIYRSGASNDWKLLRTVTTGHDNRMSTKPCSGLTGGTSFAYSLILQPAHLVHRGYSTSNLKCRNHHNVHRLKVCC